MKFTDAQGTDWHCRISPMVAGRLKKDGFDLVDPKSIQTIVSDPISQFDLLWLLVAKQAADRHVDADQFDSAIGDQWPAARQALFAAIVFFLELSGNAGTAAGIKKSIAAKDAADKALTERMDKHGDRLIDRIVTDATKQFDEAMGDDVLR